MLLFFYTYILYRQSEKAIYDNKYTIKISNFSVFCRMNLMKTDQAIKEETEDKCYTYLERN
ncbi:hypothetical protein IGI39_000686 [Enterococcus sp. AZ135]